MTIKNKTHKKSTIISDSSDKPKSKESAHYVSNPKLYESIVSWYSAIDQSKLNNTPEPKMPDTVARGIIQICQNLAKKHNWLGNSKIKEEMIGDAIEDCLRRGKGFDIHHTNAEGKQTKNPFSYFTQMAYYAFLRCIKDETFEDYVKHKSMLNALSNIDLSSMLMEGDEESSDVITMDYNQENIEGFVRGFEIKHFGEELSLDESAGNAGKRRKIPKQSTEDIGLF